MTNLQEKYPSSLIKTNKASCKLCDDIIESKYRWDFVSCKCGEIFVDGGNAYLRRGAKSFLNFLEMSEYYEKGDTKEGKIIEKLANQFADVNSKKLFEEMKKEKENSKNNNN